MVSELLSHPMQFDVIVQNPIHSSSCRVRPVSESDPSPALGCGSCGSSESKFSNVREKAARNRSLFEISIGALKSALGELAVTDTRTLGRGETSSSPKGGETHKNAMLTKDGPRRRYNARLLANL